jgi:hypothetical protein
MAAPTTWVYTSISDRPIISGDDVYIRLWVPEPELYAKTGPGTFPFDAISMIGRDEDPLTASIFGNSVDGVFPPPSPSLYVPNGLRIEGVTLESHGDDWEQLWRRPLFYPSLGYTEGAELYQAGPDGDFDLTTFSFDDDDYAYIGFADYVLNRFGYLQIERADATNAALWRLVGYAYEEPGVSIQVVDLTTVPPAPSAAVLALGFVGRQRRRRATSHAECLVSSASMV